MPSIASITAATLLLLGSCQAHFLLLSPPPAGTFDEDSEGNEPCGGVTPSFSSDNVTDFAVGGDAIATQLGHPQANFLYRFTTEESADGNWTQAYPIVQQSGLCKAVAVSCCKPLQRTPIMHLIQHTHWN